jgi:transposase
LQARHYGVGWLCAAIIWAQIGDARRFGSSDQAVRFARPDITVYSSAGKHSPGHLSRQGSPELRWEAFEAAQRRRTRDRRGLRLSPQVAGELDGKRPALAVQRKLRRCYHILRELGDAALTAPAPTRQAA